MKLEMDVDTSNFERNLTDLGVKIAATITARALRAGGEVLAGAQRDFAPVRKDKHSGGNALRPGEVRDSIQTMLDIDGEKGYAQITVGPGYADGVDTDYVANWLEHGHELTRGKKRKSKFVGKGFVEPYPFIGPAFQASAQEALDAILQTMADGINEELGASGDLITEGLS
jgi:HK97 gp10 family phage protein